MVNVQQLKMKKVLMLQFVLVNMGVLEKNETRSIKNKFARRFIIWNFI